MHVASKTTFVALASLLAWWNLQLLLSALVVCWVASLVVRWATSTCRPIHDVDTPSGVSGDSRPTPRFKINRSISVPKGHAGIYTKKKQKQKFDPRKATKERRKLLKACVEEDYGFLDDVVSLDAPSRLHRNCSIRRSGRTNGIGSTGDLSEIAKEEEDMAHSLPDIKLWSKSCGSLRYPKKDGMHVIDSWDGLKEIFNSRVFPQDDASLSRDPMQVHVHLGPIVHMDGTNEVQIGNNNVMKVERSRSDDGEDTSDRKESSQDDDLSVDCSEVDEYEVFEAHDDDGSLTCDSSTSSDHDSITLRTVAEHHERGTSYHDPDIEELEDVHPHLRDISTGTTMSLLRGSDLGQCIRTMECSTDTNDSKPKQLNQGRKKILEEMRRFRELKSQSELPVVKKKEGGIRKILRRMIPSS